MKHFNITYRNSKGHEIKLLKHPNGNYESSCGIIFPGSWVKENLTFVKMRPARCEMITNPMNGCRYRVYK